MAGSGTFGRDRRAGASIKDYITQCQAKWVAGQSDINADWDGYLEQLDKLGLDQYLEYKGAVKAE